MPCCYCQLLVVSATASCRCHMLLLPVDMVLLHPAGRWLHVVCSCLLLLPQGYGLMCVCYCLLLMPAGLWPDVCGLPDQRLRAGDHPRG